MLFAHNQKQRACRYDGDRDVDSDGHRFDGGADNDHCLCHRSAALGTDTDDAFSGVDSGHRII